MFDASNLIEESKSVTVATPLDPHVHFSLIKSISGKVPGTCLLVSECSPFHQNVIEMFNFSLVLVLYSKWRHVSGKRWLYDSQRECMTPYFVWTEISLRLTRHCNHNRKHNGEMRWLSEPVCIIFQIPCDSLRCRRERDDGLNVLWLSECVWICFYEPEKCLPGIYRKKYQEFFSRYLGEYKAKTITEKKVT